MIDAPTENLFRGLQIAPALRAATEDGPVVDGADAVDGSLMFGHFSRFATWYEIDSWYEGRFLEQTARGAFKKTIRENRSSMKVQFDHGYDYNIGDALLGPIDDLREDDQGPYFEVPLLDTDYNRERIQPMLQGRLMNGEQRGSLLGVSFRFRVTKDSWNNEPGSSEYNPEGLPERTIKEVRVMEFGPVVWPANEGADVGIRSLTDHYFERQLAREGRATRAARALANVSPRADTPSLEDAPNEPPVPALVESRGRLVAAAHTQLLRLQRSA